MSLMDPNTQPQPTVSPERSLDIVPGGPAAQPELAPAPATNEVRPAAASGNQASVAWPTAVGSSSGIAGTAVTVAGAGSGVVLAPQIADDVDVIEKEWVDAADHLIATTKHDPYTEEEAEEKLQIDYLKKRYGIDVKKF